MAIDNFGLNFQTQTTHDVPIRNRPDKYAQSPLAKRARFEVSEGIRPAEYFAAYKYLPVAELDITTGDYTVIPKGKILASLSAFDLTPTGGIKGLAASGTLYGYESQLTSTLSTYSQDSSYFGYDDFISNLLVPANGNAASTQYYTALDVSATTITASGTYAAAGDSMIIPANAPIGVAYHDWYQDIRGKNLNYNMWPDGGHVLTDWYVEVPFIVEQSGVNTIRSTGSESAVERAVYVGVSNAYSYLTVDYTENFQPGIFVQSDGIGNYKPQGAGSLTQSKTAQTVGKLMGIDTRFPKGGLQDVVTYPGSRMPGTQTAGLPSFLFEFAVATEIVQGNTPTIETVLAAVQSGKYGVARIQLLVS